MVRFKLFLFFIFTIISVVSCESGGAIEEDEIGGGEGKKVPNPSKWISEIIAYNPAPGQFINTASGTISSADGIVGGGDGLVSLGNFGGYIIFRFDHSVLNKEGYDFAIKGNAFDGSSEPGIVMVSEDGYQWYELAGENHSLSSTIKDYSITYYHPSQLQYAEDIRWEDNLGRQDFIYTDNLEVFHAQSFWPAWINGSTEELIFSGTLLTGLGKTHDNGEYYLEAAGKGYVDNYSPDYIETIGNDEDTYLSNKFDISDAVDSAGDPVVLEKINFIKVYTGMNQQWGRLGERSTEIRGAISFTVPAYIIYE